MRQDNIAAYLSGHTITEMEQIIESSGLAQAYSVALAAEVWGISRGWQDWRDTWSVICATPEQRVRAAARIAFLDDALLPLQFQESQQGEV